VLFSKLILYKNYIAGESRADRLPPSRPHYSHAIFLYLEKFKNKFQENRDFLFLNKNIKVQ
jgi:hypothetical protein